MTEHVAELEAAFEAATGKHQRVWTPCWN